MGFLRRSARARPPEDVVWSLDPGERVLSWAPSADGSTVAATRLGLWVAGDEATRRIAWELIDKVVWAAGTMRITEAREVEPGVIEELEPYTLVLPEPGNLPAVVRSRVNQSVGYSRHHRLPAGGGARIVGRRVPGRDGLVWVVRYDGGTDRHDPAVASRTAELLAEARATVESA